MTEHLYAVSLAHHQLAPDGGHCEWGHVAGLFVAETKEQAEERGLEWAESKWSGSKVYANALRVPKSLHDRMQ